MQLKDYFRQLALYDLGFTEYSNINDLHNYIIREITNLNAYKYTHDTLKNTDFYGETPHDILFEYDYIKNRINWQNLNVLNKIVMIGGFNNSDLNDLLIIYLKKNYEIFLNLDIKIVI